MIRWTPYSVPILLWDLFFKRAVDGMTGKKMWVSNRFLIYEQWTRQGHRCDKCKAELHPDELPDELDTKCVGEALVCKSCAPLREIRSVKVNEISKKSEEAYVRSGS